MGYRVTRHSAGGAGWLSHLGYVVLGAAIGAAALYVGLVTMLLGLVPVGFGAWYVWRGARARRLAFIGGLMLGIGLSAWPALGQAVTNHDPSVRYDPSTIPVGVAALVVGAAGVLLIVVGIMRARTHAPS